MSDDLAVTNFCRRWRDSNGHLFHLTGIEPDPGGRPGMLVLNGTISNCHCIERRLQFYSHNRPGQAWVESVEDLSLGNVSGWNPAPDTLVDMLRFVEPVLGLTDEQWSLLARVDDGDDIDLGDHMLVAAFFAYAVLRDLHDDPIAGEVVPTVSPVQVLGEMRQAGHTHADLVAAALIAQLSLPEAVGLPTGLDETARAALVEQLVFLPMLQAAHP